MKLKVLAVAVAASFTLPMSVVQADKGPTLKIDGDVGVFYSTKTEQIQELGSEVNFDGSATMDGITYMGHFEVDINGGSSVTADDLVTSGGQTQSINVNQSVRIDEARVGAKGGFGEVWLGDIGNACDQFDPGSNDIWLGGASQSCKGSAVNNILYKNNFGGFNFAASHNPNADQSAVGVKFGLGGFSANLGYEDGVGPDGDLISFGVAGKMNGVEVSAEGNDNDQWGVNASYTMNGVTAWIAYGEDDAVADDRIAGGLRTSHGKMDYIIEYQDFGADDETIIGMRYRF